MKKLISYVLSKGMARSSPVRFRSEGDDVQTSQAMVLLRHHEVHGKGMCRNTRAGLMLSQILGGEQKILEALPMLDLLRKLKGPPTVPKAMEFLEACSHLPKCANILNMLTAQKNEL